MCIGSTVTIRSPTRARGGDPGACSPEKILIKMVRSGAIWAFQSMLLPR